MRPIKDLGRRTSQFDNSPRARWYWAYHFRRRWAWMETPEGAAMATAMTMIGRTRKPTGT